jgi:hypothetical protein
MNTHRVVASSLSFALLLIVLVGGLSLLLTNRNLLNMLAPTVPVREPAIGRPPVLPTPTPLPTASPMPRWTVDAPLNSSPEITAFLHALSEKNLDLLASPGWLHATRSDLGQKGTLPTYYLETWGRTPLKDGAYTESLVLVKEQPQSQNLLQIQVCLADGFCGDLIALRKGQGSAEPSGLPPMPDNAGLLAQRLTNRAGLSKNGKVDRVQAWFETLDGEPVFVVSLHSTPLQPSPTTPETTEVYSFDLETGQLLRENVQQIYPDGLLFGETLTAYQYEVLTGLPASVADQFAAAASELQAFAVKTGAAPAPTATAISESVLTALEDSPYTREIPLTDGAKILELMVALRQRLHDWISQPGWYVFDSLLPHGRDWVSTRSTMLQTNGNGTCQWMVYYLKDGRILPNELYLADGVWGLIGDVQAGTFTEAEANRSPCRPDQVDHLVWMDNEIEFFRDFIAGEVLGEYRAWVETIAERPVLVLHYEIRYQNPRPVTLDPDTRKLEPQDHSKKWLYFDLETGAILREYEQVTLANGKTFGETYREDDPLPSGIHFYENLPAELLKTFEKAVQGLRSHLESITP